MRFATWFALLFSVLVTTGTVPAQNCQTPTTFGTGTPHCSGVPAISAANCPFVGNLQFALDFQNTLPSGPNTPAFVWMDLMPVNVPVACPNNPASAFVVNVLPAIQISVPPNPGNTTLQLPLPIPNFSPLIGRNFYFQFVQTEILMQCTQCGIPFLGVTASQGLDVLLQNPCPVNIMDSFTGANGSSPNSTTWVIDTNDCGIINHRVQIQNNELELYAQRQGCSQWPGGGPGVGIYTATTFSHFEITATYARQASGSQQNGGASISVRDAGRLPPGASPTPSNPVGFSVGISLSTVGQAITVTDGTNTWNPGPLLGSGDVLTLKGAIGGALEFYQNGTLLDCVSNWNPPVLSLVASLYSGPGGTSNQWRATYFDDFSLCAR